MIANIRQMPLPTNEPEHFEDWRPFMGYSDIDGCLVTNYYLFKMGSGNLKLVQWFKLQVHSQNLWLTKKVILGTCKYIYHMYNINQMLFEFLEIHDVQ